jgi:hypothetical protein
MIGLGPPLRVSQPGAASRVKAGWARTGRRPHHPTAAAGHLTPEERCLHHYNTCTCVAQGQRGFYLLSCCRGL